jgi:hypothetical protein
VSYSGCAFTAHFVAAGAVDRKLSTLFYEGIVQYFNKKSFNPKPILL